MSNNWSLFPFFCFLFLSRTLVTSICQERSIIKKHLTLINPIKVSIIRKDCFSFPMSQLLSSQLSLLMLTSKLSKTELLDTTLLKSFNHLLLLLLLLFFVSIGTRRWSSNRLLKLLAAATKTTTTAPTTTTAAAAW